MPDSLTCFNGGFSCKSFSKLNNDYEAFKRALADQMEDMS